MSNSKKFYAWSAAAIAWFALLLQFYLSIQMSIARGADAWHGVAMYFLFFTVLTNLLVGFALLLPLLAPESNAGRFFARPGPITAIAAYIVLVGLTYNLLLRNVWQPQGLQLLGDVLLHDINPILFIGYWWLFAAGKRVAYAAIGLWCVYPILYFIYALLRGATGGFYAYPFIDVARYGLVQVLLNSVVILLGFIVAAVILIAIGRLKQPAGLSDRA